MDQNVFPLLGSELLLSKKVSEEASYSWLGTQDPLQESRELKELSNDEVPLNCLTDISSCVIVLVQRVPYRQQNSLYIKWFSDMGFNDWAFLYKPSSIANPKKRFFYIGFRTAATASRFMQTVRSATLTLADGATSTPRAALALSLHRVKLRNLLINL